MTSAWAVARPTSEDVGAIVGLYNACDEHDIGHPDSDAEDVQWPWRMDSFSPAEDAWIVRAGSEVVGYGFVYDDHGEARVHPEWKGRGIGMYLLDLIEARAKGPLLNQVVSQRNPAGRDLLTSAGYRFTHSYTRMEMDLEPPPAPGRLPRGVKMRTFRPGIDDRPLHEAYLSAWSQYAGPEWHLETFDEWIGMNKGSDFHPEMWWIAMRGGDIVGFNLCLSFLGIGWVQYLGIVPAERGKGLGEAVLRYGLHQLRERGFKRAGLTVGSRNLPTARKLYEKVGMKEVLTYESLRKELA